MASFRGASADAVAALTEQVDRLDGRSSASIAEDLFALAGALRAEGSLRRFATDNSIPAEARTGLVAELYAGKVADAALEVVKEAVGRKWTRNRDLADALEHLGVIAAVRLAGSDSGALVDELFAVRNLLTEHSELRNALADPARTTGDKAALVDSLLDGKTLPATVTLVKQALSGSYRTVTAALEDYEKTAADAHGQRVATVRVARPLGDAEQRRLTQALSQQYDRPVHLNVAVEPSLIGGIRIEIGDDVIDGTIASRLADAQRRLAG
ncbi:MAG TPA: F0F1 ATP synthase subunit delta [Nocardioides sp.]|nr:F0F1 ATP synthase subunit delta [Nocardioides sp.]